MKKLKVSKAYFIICLILFNTVFLFNTSISSASNKTDIRVILNNTPLVFGTNANDPQPYIKDGRTLVPFRKIFEALGMDITWDGDTKTVYAKNATTNLVIMIGRSFAYVNGFKKDLDVPAEIKDGRTFVPLRFVGESCGAEVLWDGGTRTVSISYSNQKYALGQEASYKDIKFSIDKIEEKIDEEQIIVYGKINSKDRRLLIEIGDNSNKSHFGVTEIYGSEDGIYNYMAIVSVKKSFVPKYVFVNIYNEENKLIKIAEYTY
ncbi:MAG: stalk domain-containing protein [Bacillota bacterium]